MSFFTDLGIQLTYHKDWIAEVKYHIIQSLKNITLVEQCNLAGPISKNWNQSVYIQHNYATILAYTVETGADTCLLYTSRCV